MSSSEFQGSEIPSVPPSDHLQGFDQRTGDNVETTTGLESSESGRSDFEKESLEVGQKLCAKLESGITDGHLQLVITDQGVLSVSDSALKQEGSNAASGQLSLSHNGDLDRLDSNRDTGVCARDNKIPPLMSMLSSEVVQVPPVPPSLEIGDDGIPQCKAINHGRPVLFDESTLKSRASMGGHNSLLESLPSDGLLEREVQSTIEFENHEQERASQTSSSYADRVRSYQPSGSYEQNTVFDPAISPKHQGENQDATVARLKKEAAILDASYAATIWLPKSFGVGNEQYLEAAGQMVGDENVVAINTDDQNKVEIALVSQACADIIIKRGLVMEGQWFKAYRIAERPRKITVSKIPHFIPHSSLVEALNPYGECTTADVDSVHAYTKRRSQKHVLTYRRNVWLRVEEGNPRVPSLLVLYFAGRPFSVEISDGLSKCFSCGRSGHIRARCPDKSPNYEPVAQGHFEQKLRGRDSPALINTTEAPGGPRDDEEARKAKNRTVGTTPNQSDQWRLVGRGGKSTIVKDINTNEGAQVVTPLQPKKDRKNQQLFREQGEKQERIESSSTDMLEKSGQVHTDFDRKNRDGRTCKKGQGPPDKARDVDGDINPTETLEEVKHGIDTQSKSDEMEGVSKRPQETQSQEVKKNYTPRSSLERDKVSHLAKCFSRTKNLFLKSGQIPDDPLEGMSIDEALLAYKQNVEFFNGQQSLKNMGKFLDRMVKERMMDESDGMSKKSLKRPAPSSCSSGSFAGSPTQLHKNPRRIKVLGSKTAFKKKRGPAYKVAVLNKPEGTDSPEIIEEQEPGKEVRQRDRSMICEMDITSGDASQSDLELSGIKNELPSGHQLEKCGQEVRFEMGRRSLRTVFEFEIEGTMAVDLHEAKDAENGPDSIPKQNGNTEDFEKVGVTLH